jgi:hypothetical protein
MHAVRQLVVLGLLCGAATAPAADTPTPPVPTNPVTGEKLDPARGPFVGEWVGQVLKVTEGDSGSLSLRVDQLAQVPRGTRYQPAATRVQKDLEFTLAKDVAVRQLALPPAVNDAGKPRQRSADEVRRLKGASNLPGYVAEFSQLRAGDVVRVYLMQPKPPKGAKPGDPAPKPLVSMVVIQSEAPAKKAP